MTKKIEITRTRGCVKATWTIFCLTNMRKKRQWHRQVSQRKMNENKAKSPRGSRKEESCGKTKYSFSSRRRQTKSIFILRRSVRVRGAKRNVKVLTWRSKQSELYSSFLCVSPLHFYPQLSKTNYFVNWSATMLMEKWNKVYSVQKFEFSFFLAMTLNRE